MHGKDADCGVVISSTRHRFHLVARPAPVERFRPPVAGAPAAPGTVTRYCRPSQAVFVFQHHTAYIHALHAESQLTLLCYAHHTPTHPII